MRGKHECGADAAAYVLGALEPAEAEAFRKHLVGCAVCRDEVSAFQEVADLLPLTAPQQRVPAGLRDRVLAEVNADARVRDGTQAGQRSRRPRPQGVPSWLSIPRPAFAAAAVLAVLVIALGAIAITINSSSTRVYNASVTWQGSASVRVTNGRGELVVTRMPTPPMTKVYEVWLQRGNGRPEATATLFSPTASGSGSIDVPGNLRGVSRVMVTPEPAGGSPAPTHAPVLVARLS